MARLRITEYRAKRLLVGAAYRGRPFTQGGGEPLPKTGVYAVKVDQGIKKRLGQGLVALNVPAKKILRATATWRKKGFSRFIAEPMFPHAAKEEQYLSLERIRSGIRLLHRAHGGVSVEENNTETRSYLIVSGDDIASAAKSTLLPVAFLKHLVDTCETNHWSFVEINPLVMRGSVPHLLDTAVLVDGAAEQVVRGAWTRADVPDNTHHPAEVEVQNLQHTSPASFKLSVLNQNGSLFLLLSGGGGSLVVLDELANRGVLGDVGNYGEYGGGPTREETYLYTRALLKLLLGSKAKKKALIIAGGIANFTDVKATFEGVLDALSEAVQLLEKTGVRVFVRRGGPHERDGLTLMRTFLDAHHLLGSVDGSEAPLTRAVDRAVAYIRS